MSLAESTIKKAKTIVELNQVQQIDNNSFLVQGSKGDLYEVTKEAENLTCYKGNNVCLGWKYAHDCKHCQAVRIFLGVN